ncbi:core component of ECF transporter [Shewanella sp. 10N.261.52.F9]|mgnify:FL=1|uniref:core component of ECF transporter n=1 Tax=Shewanella TaxID=22 RepID=UPI00200EF13C|nr:core component of ECF transporter [Shewanella marinintestina]MCL1147365.1 core component of ECF transporter [Shewanella marinintestina]
MKSPFDLQDALFIGFCATLLVVLKSMLRLKLGLSGHSMFLMTFFYLICYGAVGRVGSITACGLLAGLVAMMLSVGKGGPMILLKFGLPAMAMDLALLFMSGLFSLRWQSIILALIGCLAWASKGWIGNLLAGMSGQVALVQFGINFLQGAMFAVAAALLVPPVLRRLDAHDLLHRSLTDEK